MELGRSLERADMIARFRSRRLLKRVKEKAVEAVDTVRKGMNDRNT